MVDPSRRPYRDVKHDLDHVKARFASFALGLWLVASAFIWPHFEASRANTWITGMLICVSSLAALRNAPLRWGSTLLSGWLFVSTLLVIRPIDVATLWNNLLSAALVFAFSLVPKGGQSRAGLGSLVEPRSPPSR